ncbi:Saccharopine dehydrogenase NADP binding domain-containing protein [Acetitomaculum ruminis DSM 5522]|uniref:Saccharopine dehydrogenase NADP binding domain-containing protein n=1 Tax=Acetitomaculum ruminis DSM 5522 TaxID=1120918 RepID=A0A1I0X8D8_9FIRM|nr:saccharopine dehydrogenase NADP-binding domain-containing protein [Acetitomaculum ruminis]SFA97295.1 Saccharopine dehydrogenase NADP binding domain-containing protein [Acetitomaculum ruminis DSM 5522]
MKVAVIGGSGEIGNSLTDILKSDNTLELTATYHLRSVAEDKNIIWEKCDLESKEDLKKIVKEADLVINCAGASYLNSEKVARITGEFGKIYIDPFGGKYLKNKLKDLENDGMFILSAGCFPGVSGFFIDNLCKLFDKVERIEGKMIQTEIPSKCAIKDYVLSSLNGFGKPGQYLKNKAYQADRSPKDKVKEFDNGKKADLGLYYTEELDELVKKYQVEEAYWYTMKMSPSVLKIMQKCIMDYVKNKSEEELDKGADAIRDCLLKNFDNSNNPDLPKVNIEIDVEGTIKGKEKRKSIDYYFDNGSRLSAFFISQIVMKLKSKKKKNGIYWGTDIVDYDCMKELCQFSGNRGENEK